MSLRRLAAAAGILLGLVYLKLCLPSFEDAVLPALKETIGVEQVRLDLPENWTAWLSWD